VTNFAGNAVATVIIGRWTGELDTERATRVLNGEEPFDEITMLDEDEPPADFATVPAAPIDAREPALVTV
jgi:aerobic C4-dicarboxylate transport protein